MKQLLGSTSWLVAGTYYENAKLVVNKVDFVELLVYAWDEETKKLIEDEMNGLVELQSKGLFYTVHLPTDDALMALQAFRYFENSPMKILNYVLHPMNGLDELLLNSKKVSIENLTEKFVEHERITFDVGHYFLGVKNSKVLPEKIVELHMMGFDERAKKDHLPIDRKMLKLIRDRLWFDICKIPLVCFEIFDFDQVLMSIRIYKEAMEDEVL
ncbi:hypothetical protein [Pseudothermotoga thermarum]|uniref:Xylose isomerase domain-containing protein TIM barrel n=1 Tax=Pseudothermotoga thermarum DSM 5069 TaxID=688269 RepID=F7YVV8_9THEM|nr:hypothetical protein [Pseudothermotoga thermarum]AEH51780.1 hypothetical protein Theth_1736 [Pseudothermotoga thermarum DSM 5069]